MSCHGVPVNAIVSEILVLALHDKVTSLIFPVYHLLLGRLNSNAYINFSGYIVLKYISSVLG